MNEVHYCHYTGKPIPAGEEIVVGAIIPNVKAKYYVSDIELHKRSKRLFDESEANCNTCKHLVRVKHDKCRSGFLYGKCAKDGAELMFHPDDPMHMACYQQRD